MNGSYCVMQLLFIHEAYLMPAQSAAQSLRGTMAHKPFLISAGIYAIVTTAILVISFHAADGHLVYALDDTYINMAMAKNFSMHGVWGVSPYEFTSSTSSPLYVLLLSSIYRITGISSYVPLLLSWIFGIASIYVAEHILAEYLTEAWQTAVLIAVVFFTPLFVIGILGMEHSLHLLLTLLFLQRFDRPGEPPWIIAAISASMVATRYEGIFMAAAACLILIVACQWKRSAIIGIAAWFPVGVYALFSVCHKGYWLPNSIALKGIKVHGLGINVRLINVFAVAISNSIRGAGLLFLIIGLAIAALSMHKRDPRLTRLLWLIAISGLLHLLTADVGWVFRYEDYLIGAGIVIAACTIPRLQRLSGKDTVCAACLLLSSVALIGRSVLAMASLPKYSRAIYLQQWQMARFLNIYYTREPIAINDIGLINFRNDFHCLDLTGLASAEVFAAKHSASYSTHILDHIASTQKTEIAVIYDSWFSEEQKISLGGPSIPPSWIRVERWKVPQQEQLGSDTVSFYALSEGGAKILKTNLYEFDKTLPMDVKVTP